MEGLRLARVLVGMNIAERGNRNDHFMQRVVTRLVRADPDTMSSIGQRPDLEERQVMGPDPHNRILRNKDFVVNLLQTWHIDRSFPKLECEWTQDEYRCKTCTFLQSGLQPCQYLLFALRAE